MLNNSLLSDLRYIYVVLKIDFLNLVLLNCRLKALFYNVFSLMEKKLSRHFGSLHLRPSSGLLFILARDNIAANCLQNILILLRHNIINSLHITLLRVDKIVDMLINVNWIM